MNDSFKTLLAFIGGVAAGAALGVLLAPDKGADTRKKILSRAKDLTDDLSDAAKDKYNEFLSWKDSIIDETEKGIKNTVHQYADKANQFTDKAEKTVNQYTDKAENKIKNAHV